MNVNIDNHINNKYFAPLYKLGDDYLLSIPENKFLLIPDTSIQFSLKADKIAAKNLDTDGGLDIPFDRNFQGAFIATYISFEIARRDIHQELVIFFNDDANIFNGRLFDLMGLSPDEQKSNRQLVNSMVYNDCVLVEERTLLYQYIKELQDA